MTASKDIPQRIAPKVMEAWLRQFVATYHPTMIAGLAARDLEDANDYDEVAKHYIDNSLVPYPAPMLAQLFNGWGQYLLDCHAAEKSERTIVVAHDERGRIKETLRVPAWARPEFTIPPPEKTDG